MWGQWARMPFCVYIRILCGWPELTIDANPIPLLRVIIAERNGKKNADAGSMHPTKGIHRIVFVLALAITAVAMLQSHAHSAFAHSPYEGKIQGPQGV
jgi:hypothetical protein